jgi:hypothetical protein
MTSRGGCVNTSDESSLDARVLPLTHIALYDLAIQILPVGAIAGLEVLAQRD